MKAVVVKNLRKSYGDFEALKGVSFDVETGEVFSLLGPNGAGKTTALEILEGFRKCDSGDVEVLGYDPSRPTRAFREQLGIVLQELAVEHFLSVREVLRRNAGYYPNPKPVDEVIDRVGLNDKADARVKTLSGGQQRRLDVGLGIIGNPSLVFLDEPTTGFDPSARRGAWDLIRSLQDEGTTVILTTHYMDEAEALADRVAIMSKGEIVAHGPPRSIGGRDIGDATIRFRVEDGAPPPNIDARLARDGSDYSITTNDDLRVLNRLTSWAIENKTDLVGLVVERVTLEDIYIRLTGARDEETVK